LEKVVSCRHDSSEPGTVPDCARMNRPELEHTTHGRCSAIASKLAALPLVRQRIGFMKLLLALGQHYCPSRRAALISNLARLRGKTAPSRTLYPGTLYSYSSITPPHPRSKEVIHSACTAPRVRSQGGVLPIERYRASVARRTSLINTRCQRVVSLGLRWHLVQHHSQAQGFPHSCRNKGPVQQVRPKATMRAAPSKAHRAPVVTIVMNTPVTILTPSFIRIRMMITTTLMVRNR